MLEGIVNPCTIKAIEAIEDCTMDEFIKKISKHLRLVPKKDIDDIEGLDQMRSDRIKMWEEILPPVMYVEDVKSFTRLGNTKVYEMLNHPKCPTISCGRKAVYRDEFIRFYLDNYVGGERHECQRRR